MSPEGHVLHVNTTTNIIDVENEIGVGVPCDGVTNNTVFYSGATQISTTGAGIAFLTNIERGFRVHASGVVFPLTSPLVADTINIETARYDGVISIPGASTTDFTYTRNFSTVQRRLRRHPALHFPVDRERQRSYFRQPNNRFQVVEFHIPDGRRQ